MTAPASFLAHNFDQTRITWGLPEFGGREHLGIDLLYPEYIARRNEFFMDMEAAPEPGKWQLTDRSQHWPAQDTDAVARICELAEAEFLELTAYGIKTPQRSGFIIKKQRDDFGDSFGASFSYARFIKGESLNPEKPSHLPHALAFAKGALGYLGKKAVGDLFLPDVLTRNFMVGAESGTLEASLQQLYFIDTDPLVEPVTVERTALYTDSSGNDVGPRVHIAQYIYNLLDVRDTIQRIPSVSSEVESQLAGLHIYTDVLLKTYGY